MEIGSLLWGAAPSRRIWTHRRRRRSAASSTVPLELRTSCKGRRVIREQVCTAEPEGKLADGRSRQAAAAAAVVWLWMDVLTKNWPLHVPPDLDKLKDIAVGFEAKIYANAINKDDYILKINLKLLLVANTDQGRTTTEPPSHPNPSVVVKSSTHSGLLDSTAGLISPVDWQEEIFEKETVEKSAKRLEQYEILGNFIKSMIKFLQSTKSDVRSDWKDDVFEYERKIESILASKNRTFAPAQLQATLRTAVDLPDVPQVQDAQKITSQGGSATAQNMKRGITVICCEMGSTSKRQKGEVETLPCRAHGSAAGGIKLSDTIPGSALGHTSVHVSAAGGIKLSDTIPGSALGHTSVHGSAAGGIKSGVRLSDTIPGSALGHTSIGEDLVATTNWHSQARNFMSPLRMKREMGSPPIRRENYNGILAEILGINQQLFFTLVSITGKAVSTSNSSGGGTMIKFFFKTPFLQPDMRSPFSLSRVAPLTLLIPGNYPACSPIIVDNPRVDASCSEESQIVGIQAWAMFNASIGSLMQPVSVAGNIEEKKEICPRSTLLRMHKGIKYAYVFIPIVCTFYVIGFPRKVVLTVHIVLPVCMVMVVAHKFWEGTAWQPLGSLTI